MEELLVHDKTLCNNHNQIIHELRHLKNHYNLSKEAKGLVRILMTRVRYCKKQGQRMENRLTKYKRAIEDLGFKRVGGFHNE